LRINSVELFLYRRGGETGSTNLRQPSKAEYGAKSCQFVWKYKNKRIAYANRFCDLRDRCNEIGIFYAPFFLGKSCIRDCLLLLLSLLLLLLIEFLQSVSLTTSSLICGFKADVMIGLF
jgi:hypothetical protein